jgi:hypothetical protein
MSDQQRMKHLPDVAVVSHSIETAKAYRFRFKEAFGWAIFTINDATGEFSIQSDYGNWSYRWHVGSNLGTVDDRDRTLTEFLATAGPDYIINKLSYGSDDLKDVLDPAGTRKAIKLRVAEAYRDCIIDRDELRDALFDLRHRVSLNDGANELYHSVTGALGKALGEEWFLEHFYETRRSWPYLILCHKLLPFFQAWLREHVILGAKG